jgi:hypothetical protein
MLLGFPLRQALRFDVPALLCSSSKCVRRMEMAVSLDVLLELRLATNIVLVTAMSMTAVRY